MARVRINGKVYHGSNISIHSNGLVQVDGKEQSSDPQQHITITVEDGRIENLHVENGDVTCREVGGNVHAGGAVQAGNVEGNVDAGGAVRCGNVGGDVNAESNVTCGPVAGAVSARGSVRHR